tara:strand:- start:43 stop:537 length:495 start_codon:yes stop_codon:yes gene_type:complete
VKLKRSYSAREVAIFTGLSARQLQWWDARHLFSATVASRPTKAGGFTERRYSPIDLYELLALADLRRQGFTVQNIRTILSVLREQFNVRLFDALGDGGDVTLLTDGREVYVKTSAGEIFNLLRNPGQPLLVVGGGDQLKGLSGRARPRRRKTARKATKSKKATP